MTQGRKNTEKCKQHPGVVGTRIRDRNAWEG